MDNTYEDMAHSAWAANELSKENVTLKRVLPRYNRSPILSFWDLTGEEQLQALWDANDPEHAHERQYVYHNIPGGHDVLPLDMFVRTNSNIWHGVYGTGYWTAYFIRLNRSNDEALVAERYS